jgi:hypothetical protein
LAGGSPDVLIKMITDDVAAGIRTRYEHAAETFKHKEESIKEGREFVKAYVEFTHYVERLHLIATGKGPHIEHGVKGQVLRLDKMAATADAHTSTLTLINQYRLKSATQ